MFHDRIDAGVQLGDKIGRLLRDEPVLLAIPRGGVVVAHTIAKHHGVPMDVIVIRKIGHPENEEYAIGAVSANDSFIHPLHSRGVPHEYVTRQIRVKQQEALERYRELRGEKPPLDLRDKTAILVDDGVATGSTMIMAIMVVRSANPKKVAVAVPVAPPNAVRQLEGVADDVVCLLQPPDFMAIGQFYEDFRQVSTQEARQLMEEL
jgi:predicted phosphoribosyltransferase